jgi:hypothetical protein
MSESCPYCAEEIKPDAKKCRHCGEFLGEAGGRYEQDPDAWGGENKPQSVLVFGVINIAFGLLGAVGMVFSLFVLAVLPKQNNPLLNAMNSSEGYQIFQNVSMVIGGFAAIVLIVAGYGLCKMKPWSRKLSIYYALFALLQILVGTIANYFLLVGPMLQKSQGGPEVIMAVSTMLGGCLGLIFPACILFFLTRPKVLKAFKRIGEPGS